MRPPAASYFLIMALCPPAHSGPVDLSVTEEAPSAPATAQDAAPTAVSLSLSAPTAAPSAALLAPAVPSATAALPAAAAQEEPAAAPATPAAQAAHPAAGRPSVSGDAATQADPGRALFDAEATTRPSLWQKARALFPRGASDAAPRSGSTVRAGGARFVLDRSLGRRADAELWTTRTGDYTAALRPATPAAARQAALFQALNAAVPPLETDATISRDGSVLVRAGAREESAAEAISFGFRDSQKQGWAELAAKLIRGGATADLAPDNLAFNRWHSRWDLLSLDGLSSGKPGDVLAQMLTSAARAAGVDDGQFLAGVRGRLGPDSADWTRVADALSEPRLSQARAALDAHDRALPPPPRVAYDPDPAPAALTDRAVAPAEIARVLGYDPLTVKAPRRLLHTDDPGKLNTQVFAVEPPGRTPVVVKIASWDIVRRELAMRRVVRRFFGRYFETPSAFGVKRGGQSYLVMELHPGQRAYAHSPMTPDQRAALAVLARGLGLGDMNQGNVLFSNGRRPALIDFEQSLHLISPVASRIPDEGIAQEMPWLTRRTPNRIEDLAPAIREWRRVLAEPATRAALSADFQAAGFSPEESAALLAVVDRNASRLDWTLQNDVDFVNQFVRTPAGSTPRSAP
ncbi:MAG: hypothetical protein HKL90_07555 [Elusimicrobia bacterium]|nr:hypothetical protein [Elusimicrobiota bacterium]